MQAQLAKWSGRRDKHDIIQKKDESQRLGIARKYTIKFGDELLAKRDEKNKKLAEQDSLIYLNRQQSKSQMEKLKQS
jgi:hypothetical protein